MPRRPRSPPATGKVREAIDKLASSAVEVLFLTERLDDDDLRALKTELKRRYGDDQEPYTSYWAGIDVGIDARLRERAAWRKETGTWYAVFIRFTAPDPTSTLIKGEDQGYIECRGRRKAIEAARELRAKYADEFNAFDWVEVRICPKDAADAPKDT